MAASSSSDEKGKRDKLYCLYLYKVHDEGKVTELVSNVDVSHFPFFHRSTVKEHIKFRARTVTERTQVGRRQSVVMEDNMGMAHCWIHPEKIGGIVICGPDYPQRVAFQLLSEIIRLFTARMKGKFEHLTQDAALNFPEGAELFAKFQDPREGDKLTKIEKELDDVKEVVVQSMDAILKRGEDLNSLMKKSDDLSSSSYQFYRTAKKNNQCCQMY